MSLGKGIAIAGIWFGVGLIGLSDGGAGACASIFAFITTCVIAHAD